MKKGHRRHEHHHRPKHQSADEFPFVLREEEKSQPHNTIQLYKRSQHDKERCPEVLFLFYQIVSQQDGCGNGDIELLHKQSRQHLVGTEPENKYLLVLRKLRFTDGPIEKDRQRNAP